VPEAATMPILPRGTTLANASGAPPMIAVPQSGPIISKPRCFASRLSATSSSIGTLSLNIITCRPLFSARRASAAANSPGTEMSARFAAELRPGALWRGVPRGVGFPPAAAGPRRGRPVKHFLCFLDGCARRAFVLCPHRDDEVVGACAVAVGVDQARVAHELLVRG